MWLTACGDRRASSSSFSLPSLHSYRVHRPMENRATLIAQSGNRCLGGLLSFLPVFDQILPPSLLGLGSISPSAYYGQILHVKHAAAASD